jgi:putative transposase
MRYKYRIYPNKDQENLMVSMGGATRFIFNHFLKRNSDQYAIDKKFVWYYEMAKELTVLKHTSGYEWLYETPNQCLQQSLRDLNAALKNLKHGASFPRFKSKYLTPISFRFQQYVELDPSKKKVNLPMLGDVKIVMDRALPSRFTGVTVYRNNIGHWYVSFVVERQELLLVDEISSSTGVDVNSEFTALSNGDLRPNIRPYKKYQKKIKQLQRELSRKQKGSNNRKKAKQRLARASMHLANQRKDQIHKNSNRIAKDYDLVSVETLKIDAMKRKSKGAAKAIQDTAWATFLLALEYKCRLYGHHFQKINQWLASSKTCSACGTKQSIPLDIRQYTCPCGLDIHRDTNAAINIDNWGRQQWFVNSKTGQELPSVPVDSLVEILSSDGTSATEMKQESTAL